MSFAIDLFEFLTSRCGGKVGPATTAAAAQNNQSPSKNKNLVMNWTGLRTAGEGHRIRLRY